MTRIASFSRSFSASFSNPNLLSRGQIQGDALSSSFTSQATNTTNIASLALAGFFGQITRLGVLSSFSVQSAPLSLLRNVISQLTSIGMEASVLEGLNRFFQNQENFFSKSWCHSAITIGSFRLFSPFFAGQNFFLQQGLQATALISAHQIAASLGLQAIPQENLAEQFVGAVASNLTLHTGSLLGHRLTGTKLFMLERNLHLSAHAIQDTFERCQNKERVPLYNAHTKDPESPPAIENSGELQAYLNAAQKAMQDIISNYRFLYQEAYHRPLLGFDRLLEARLEQIANLQQRLLQYDSNIRNSGVIPLKYPHYTEASRYLNGLPDFLRTELRKTGMSPKIANEVRNKLRLAVGALGPGTASFQALLQNAFPIQHLEPLRPKSATVEQVKGIFLGGAIGDAYAAPLEFMTPEQIRASNFDFTRFNAKGNRAAGSWTDDTLFVLATLDSLLRERALVPRQLSRSFAALAPEQKRRGFGHATKTALKRIERGSSWSSSGSQDAAGNGAAMRIAPLAIWSYRSLNELRKNVILASQITHAGYEAIAGSLATAFVLAKILQNDFHPENILAETRRFIGPGQFSAKLLEVERHLQDPSLSTQEGIQRLGIGGVVWESVASALYTFLRHPRDFNRILTELAQAGGDTDTMASLAGQFYGALHGTQGIPPPWMREVEKSEEIVQKAETLFRLMNE